MCSTTKSEAGLSCNLCPLSVFRLMILLLLHILTDFYPLYSCIYKYLLQFVAKNTLSVNNRIWKMIYAKSKVKLADNYDNYY